MGRGTIRAGAPTQGTVAAAGSANDSTDPRIILFNPPVRPCIVANHSNKAPVLVKTNTELTGTVSETFEAANGRGHIVLPARRTLKNATKSGPEGGACWADVSQGGRVAVHSVSIATTDASTPPSYVSVIGFEP